LLAGIAEMRADVDAKWLLIFRRALMVWTRSVTSVKVVGVDGVTTL